MTRPNWKTIRGQSAREDTAITLRSIKEILAESDEPVELLSAKPAPEPTTEVAQAPKTEATPKLPGNEKPSLQQRLKSRFFGG